MTLTLQELEQGPLGPTEIDAFLASRSFPIVEGTTITFVFRGDVDEIHLRHWIHGLSTTQPLTRIEGTDLWTNQLELPEGSRMEYKFEVFQRGGRRWIQDPLNPHLAHDPYGANSVVHASGYEIPEWTLPDPEARPGRIQELTFSSDVLHETRPLHVYLPARYRETRRYPLLVVHDGSDFMRFSGLQTVLDNLIHRLEIPPLVVAMVDSPRRLVEYADDAKHAEFVAVELVEALEDRYPLLETPSMRGIMGASFGGVASLAAAWRHPGVFDNMLLLSGSFAFTDIGEHEGGPAFDPVVDFVNAFRKDPGHPSERIYMACGIYEPMIYYNRSLLPVLQDTGAEVRYSESRDGHNWENWRDRLREGLSWLFPGPLWMVYE